MGGELRRKYGCWTVDFREPVAIPDELETKLGLVAGLVKNVKQRLRKATIREAGSRIADIVAESVVETCDGIDVLRFMPPMATRITASV